MSVFPVLRKKGLLRSQGFFNVSPHTLFLIDTEGDLRNQILLNALCAID